MSDERRVELPKHASSRRYYNLVNSPNGILRKGREVFLTGCHLRTAREGAGFPRLLPTEYLVILLDEDLDEDAILIGAQFCSDSFSSINLDTVKNDVSYSLYARIESIGSLEIQGKFSTLQKKQIILVDSDGVKLKLLLWNEQVTLASLFSVGSMLALDRPYIVSSSEVSVDCDDEFCLEYGTATQLYLVPFVQHEEQVCVALTQNGYQGSRLLTEVDPTQGPKVSQVSLPCDSHGSIDFSNYPFRSLIIDIRDKMTGISLYGVVVEISCEKCSVNTFFSLKIEDNTGTIGAKLHFEKSWSLGRLSPGHVVYISGLTCSVTEQNCLGVLWFEKDHGASFVNICCLPALLNSSCLHKQSHLCDLTSQPVPMHVCHVWLDQVDHCYVTTRSSHVICGHFVNKMPNGDLQCSFCHCNCNDATVLSFHLNVTLADETAKVFAWCTGQTAVELLQISPEEFYELPEDEQVMYPSSLENETFTVALVNCKKHGKFDDGIQGTGEISWEITRAVKSE